MYRLNIFSNSRYSALPTDGEDFRDSLEAPEHAPRPYGPHWHRGFFSRRLDFLRRRHFLKPIFIASFILLILLVLVVVSWLTEVRWGRSDFAFEGSPRPEYLGTPLKRPLAIRLAIMSRVDEFKRRRVLRESMLTGIPESDLRLEYKFVVGRPSGWLAWLKSYRLRKEMKVSKDVLVLKDLKDVKQRLSEKRFRALEWANSVSHNEYEYSMTIDSDTFVRFTALARRLRHSYPELKPMEEPILIARMNGHRVYFENTVPDSNVDDEDEDYHVSGPWYSFPIGYAYILSSNLTATILSANPPVPHHVNYPSDDVMVGAWIAALRNFPDPSIIFETTEKYSPPPSHRVHPRPYIPYAIDTSMIDIKSGWHDFKNRGGGDDAIGWESVCVHRMKLNEMRAFRQMKEVRMEWEDKTLS